MSDDFSQLMKVIDTLIKSVTNIMEIVRKNADAYWAFRDKSEWRRKKRKLDEFNRALSSFGAFTQGPYLKTVIEGLRQEDNRDYRGTLEHMTTIYVAGVLNVIDFVEDNFRHLSFLPFETVTTLINSLYARLDLADGVERMLSAGYTEAELTAFEQKCHELHQHLHHLVNELERQQSQFVDREADRAVK